VVSVVYCWPSVPKFSGSNPAEAVGFLRAKNPQHAFLQRGSKAAGPMSQICSMQKIPTCSVEVDMVGEISGQFSPTKFHIWLLGSLASCGRGCAWRRKLERSKLGRRRDSGSHNKPAGCCASEAYAPGPW
jgi:hypothetical protein